MRNTKILFALLPALCLTACAQPEYTPAEDSGLEVIAPYPGPKSVCVRVAENELTQDYMDDSAILIACPRSYGTAIKQRVEDGGLKLAQVGEWQLISMPLVPPPPVTFSLSIGIEL